MCNLTRKVAAAKTTSWRFAWFWGQTRPILALQSTSLLTSIPTHELINLGVGRFPILTPSLVHGNQSKQEHRILRHKLKPIFPSDA